MRVIANSNLSLAARAFFYWCVVGWVTCSCRKKLISAAPRFSECQSASCLFAFFCFCFFFFPLVWMMVSNPISQSCVLITKLLRLLVCCGQKWYPEALTYCIFKWGYIFITPSLLCRLKVSLLAPTLPVQERMPGAVCSFMRIAFLKNACGGFAIAWSIFI